MPIFDLKTTERLLDGLGVLFYVALAAALLTVLLGSPGWAFLMLLFGAGALVVRTALELQGTGR
ncbi:MAG: hypothetical protein ACM3Q9_00530 [Methanosarcina sp.]